MYRSTILPAILMASTALAMHGNNNQYGNGYNQGNQNDQGYSNSGNGWGSYDTTVVVVEGTATTDMYNQWTTAPAYVATSDVMANQWTTTTMMEETTTSCDTMWETTTAAAYTPPSWTSSYAATATQASGSFAPPSWDNMMVQIVAVSDSNGSLSYWPEQVVAPVGSIVQFQYNPKNHTVTQSSFAAPCVPITESAPENLTATRPGIDSGFVPISEPIIPLPGSGLSAAVAEDITVFNLLVNDTLPIWIFCRQTNHCAKGMSMVINVNQSDPTKQLSNYKANAALLLQNDTAAAPPGAPYGAPPGAPPGGYGTTMMTTTAPYAAPTAVPPPPGVGTTTAAVVPPPSLAPIQTTTAPANPAFTGGAAALRHDLGAGHALAAMAVGVWAVL